MATIQRQRTKSKAGYRQYTFTNDDIWWLWYAKLDKELEEIEIDPIDLQFYNTDSDPILEWLKSVENQEDPLLDEMGNLYYPLHFIIEAIEEEEAYPQQEKDSPQSKCGRRS